MINYDDKLLEDVLKISNTLGIYFILELELSYSFERSQ